MKYKILLLTGAIGAIAALSELRPADDTGRRRESRVVQADEAVAEPLSAVDDDALAAAVPNLVSPDDPTADLESAPVVLRPARIVGE